MASTNGSADNTKPLLDVQGLKTYFYTEDGIVQAINGVDFNIKPGQVMGLVGESGSGKSVTSLSIMRLLPASGKIVEGVRSSSTATTWPRPATARCWRSAATRSP